MMPFIIGALILLIVLNRVYLIQVEERMDKIEEQLGGIQKHSL